MYYLDLYSLYKQVPRDMRVAVRKELNRDAMMAYRLKLQRNLCFYCACEITMNDHLDHLIPVYFGGSNKSVNLVAACKSCNITKFTHQIEITNPYTIKDYLRMQKAHKKWMQKIQKDPRQKRYTPKHAKFYGIYRADLFKSIG